MQEMNNGSIESPGKQTPRTKKETYKVLRFLGDGSYATVYEALHVFNGQKCALKIFDKATLRKGQDKAIVNEIKIMAKLRHSNIVGLLDAFETKTKVYVAMELATGGELWEKLCNIGYYCEGDAAHLLQQLLTAVEHLHAHGIVHRDIKPENLLFSDQSPKARLLLADFGLAEVLCPDVSLQLLDNVCGTAGYMAPEVLMGTGYKGQQADIWSVGMVAYFLLSGTSPFDENALDAAEASHNPAFALLKEYKSVMDCVDPEDAVCASECVVSFTPEQTWQDISQEAKDFVSSLLYYRPAARPSARQALQHPFIHKYDKKKGNEDPKQGASGCTHEEYDSSSERPEVHAPKRRETVQGELIDKNGETTNGVVKETGGVPVIGQALTPDGVENALTPEKKKKNEDKKNSSDGHGQKRPMPSSFVSSSCDKNSQNGLPDLSEHLRQYMLRSNSKRKDECEQRAEERWRKTMEAAGKSTENKNYKEDIRRNHDARFMDSDAESGSSESL